jgi:outer membrane immunogenic protein
VQKLFCSRGIQVKLNGLRSSAGAFASSAVAAEIAIPKKAPVVKAPPPAPVATSPVSFYAGLHAGWGWSRFSAATAIETLSTSGLLGGLQLGANLQSGNFVYGIEGDVSIANVRGNGIGTIGGVAATSTVRHRWFATLAGRVGYAMGRTLVYGKGGAAWTQYHWNFATAAAAIGQKHDRFGWLVGGGAEQAWTDTISIKLEYNYMDFGRSSETFTPGALVVPATNARLYAHVAKLGVNYRFVAGR